MYLVVRSLKHNNDKMVSERLNLTLLNRFATGLRNKGARHS